MLSRSCISARSLSEPHIARAFEALFFSRPNLRRSALFFPRRLTFELRGDERGREGTFWENPRVRRPYSISLGMISWEDRLLFVVQIFVMWKVTFFRWGGKRERERRGRTAESVRSDVA